MTYRDDLVEEVLLNLSGFLTDQELIGTLAGNIVSNAATFTVTGSVFADGATGFQPGIAEIGNELVYVGNVAPATGVFSLVSRGFRGTTAAAWVAGTQVRANPRVPRISVVRAINDTLQSLYPRLYGVNSTEFTASGSVMTYDLPATTVDVLKCSWQVPGPSGFWPTIRRWRFDPNASTSSATGKQVTIWEGMSGRKVQVVVRQTPGQFSLAAATNEDYTTATNLPEWTKEVVTLGAAFKIMSFMDAGTVSERTAEGALMGSQGGSGVSAQKLAAHLYAMYQERLTNAESQLRATHDVGTVHYTG